MSDVSLSALEMLLPGHQARPHRHRRVKRVLVKWLRENLFSSWLTNTILTVLSLILIYLLLEKHRCRGSFNGSGTLRCRNAARS